MKHNVQEIERRLVKPGERVERTQGDSATWRARPAKSRLVAGLLAGLLVGLVVLVPFLTIREVHAQNACIILCLSTATPRPKPSPTPTSRPKPSPTAKPTPTPTATATAKPTPALTATATAQPIASPAPTVAATEAKHTPITSLNHISPTSRQDQGSQPGSGVLLVSAIAVLMIFLLLLALGGGWLLIRSALVSPVDSKLPPSGARPWSRFRIPNPNSLFSGINAPNTREQETPLSVRTTVAGDFPAHASGGSAPSDTSYGSWRMTPGNVPTLSTSSGEFPYADLETDRNALLSGNGNAGHGVDSSMIRETSSFLAPQSSLNYDDNTMPDSQRPSSPASSAFLDETTIKMRKANG